MKRTIYPEKKNKLEEYFANLGFPKGGMTPYPPDDCPAPRFTTNEQKIKWVDNQFCVRECKPNYCTASKRYKKYLYRKMGKEL